MSEVLQNIDRYEVVFDDESLVADAGLLAAGTLMDRLGLEDVVDRTVRLGGRVGGAHPGRKVCTLVAAMLVGASHIDHVGRLRAGSTDRVLAHAVMAPSTVGTFLRSFTWGHVRQLEKVVTLALGRAWRAGAGPGKGAVTLDVDSTICAVSGKTKQGAAYGYTKELGYHPLLAFRADTGEVVGARLRAGASQRGVVHFVGETIRRVRRAGARGPVSVRADSGFWSYAMLAALDKLGVGWSITTQVNDKVRTLINNIDKDAWTPIDYPRGGEAQVGGNRPGDDQPQETVAAAPGPSRGAPHPPRRFPSPAMARLAVPHLRHQPGPSRGRSRPAPPTRGRTRRHRPPTPRRTRHRSGRTVGGRDR